MPQKPLDVSTPLFYPRAEEQQASLPGEQPRDANAARIHKSVRVCSHMVHHKQPYGKRRAVFYCNFPGRCGWVHHRGREQPAPRVQRTAGQKRPGGAFLGRGRVPNRVHHKQPYGKRRAVFLLLFCVKAQPSASSDMRTTDVRDVRELLPTNVGGSRMRMNTLNLQSSIASGI